MTCKEKILSNDYVDILTDFEQMDQLLEEMGLDACYHRIDAGYGVANIRKSETPPISIGFYGYASIPKLYGLMQVDERIFDSSPLVAMGNIRVQNPPLSLQGNGVIIGFIDTGERVIILSSQRNLRKYKGFADLILRKNAYSMKIWC